MTVVVLFVILSEILKTNCVFNITKRVILYLCTSYGADAYCSNSVANRIQSGFAF